MSGHGGRPLGPVTPPPEPGSTSAVYGETRFLGDAVMHLANIDRNLQRIAQALERIANTPRPRP